MTITLQETFRAVFYAPFYAAIALRAYEEEGVDVQFVPSERPSDAARPLLDGTIDVVWGGPMRVMRTHDQTPGCDLVCFCEVVARDPFFLVGREPRPDFRLADLTEVRFARVSEVPTPWMCLQEDLRRAGIDPDRLERSADRTMAENADAMRRGEVDVVQVLEPFVEELLNEGAGHVWYAAADRGPTAYTTLYARRPFIEAHRDELKRMVRALFRTQKWLYAATETEIAEVVAPYFPHVAQARLSNALARYKRLGVWSETPLLSREGYDRLKAGLLSGALIRQAVPYEQAVDTSLAAEVVGEDPTPIRRRAS